MQLGCCRWCCIYSGCRDCCSADYAHWPTAWQGLWYHAWHQQMVDFDIIFEIIFYAERSKCACAQVWLPGPYPLTSRLVLIGVVCCKMSHPQHVSLHSGPMIKWQESPVTHHFTGCRAGFKSLQWLKVFLFLFIVKLYLADPNILVHVWYRAWYYIWYAWYHMQYHKTW